MNLVNSFDEQAIRSAMDSFIERRRPPIHLREKVDLCYSIEGKHVLIFEVRAHWRDPERKTTSDIAKARHIGSRDVWKIYWKRADGKWHSYEPRPEVETIEEFIETVDSDAYHCFWG
jgi:hypothetical protein